MLTYELGKLIKSMSSAEKKRFKQHCISQEKRYDYIILYELANKGRELNINDWQGQFALTFPKKSFRNTAAYLYNVLCDILVQIRIEQDDWYKQYHHIMKARLCSERSMSLQALKELRKAEKLASIRQDHMMAYQALRMQLTSLADLGFPQMNEKELVEKQMTAKGLLQSQRQIQEHYSLYELLRLRLTKGRLAIKNRSSKDKQTNDLILGELSLSTRGSLHQFEPQKLHLLFQSFFFIHSGEYPSALRVFRKLNSFIDSQEEMWEFPPYDYLSALDGILDSLRSIGYINEMNEFIKKTQELSLGPYPEHFRNVAQLTHAIYSLNYYLRKKEFILAYEFLQEIHCQLQTTIIEGHEKYLELQYFEAVVYFSINDLRRCKKVLNKLLDTEIRTNNQVLYRATRLLFVLISYEKADGDFLEYELRSYRRIFNKMGRTYKMEKLIFNVITVDPPRRGNIWKAREREIIRDKVDTILAERTEMSLNKFINFRDWILSLYD